MIDNLDKKESLQIRSNLMNNSEYEIIGDYINNKTKIKILHKKCGNVVEQTPNAHLRGRKCFNCYGIKKLNKSSLQIKSSKIHNDEYIILDDFTDSNEYIKIYHKLCDSVFKMKPSNHLRTKCRHCCKTKKGTKYTLIEKSKKIHGDDYEIIGDYINSSTKIEILHKICNLTFKQSPNDHLSGVSCPNCAKNKRLTNIEILERVKNIFGDEYQIISDIDNIRSFDDVDILHKKCNILSSKKLYSFLNGHGCNYCKESIGEKLIRKILTDMKINFIREYKFEDCRFINKLPFDFYLPKYNLCIEFNGIQHYEPIEFFGGIKSFEKRILIDNIKREYCDVNKISLLVIKYDEDIESKIKNQLRAK